MKPKKPELGFSLFEVVIAVGIFALAVSVILALLPGLSGQAAGSADTQAALRLPDGVRLELQRVAKSGGFDALAGRTVKMASPLPETLTLVAARDAGPVQTRDYLPPPATEQIAADEQYFLIEAWSFGAAPLAFDPGGAGLALHVQVSWPFQTPGAATPTPLTQRDFVTFNLVLSR